MIPAGEHPAAPEGETDASARLTRAEIKALLSVERDEDAIAAVERIVAERLRVVEGERDAWERLHLQQMMARDSWIKTARDMQARAESAEARLRAVEALADEWDVTPDFRAYYGDHARALRALLAEGGDTPSNLDTSRRGDAQ